MYKGSGTQFCGTNGSDPLSTIVLDCAPLSLVTGNDRGRGTVNGASTAAAGVPVKQTVYSCVVVFFFYIYQFSSFHGSCARVAQIVFFFFFSKKFPA